MLGKEFRAGAFLGGFGGDGLGAIFAKLENGTVVVGIGPRAARTIETAFLIGAQQCLGAANHSGLRLNLAHRIEHRRGSNRFGGRRGLSQPQQLTRRLSVGCGGTGGHRLGHQLLGLRLRRGLRPRGRGGLCRVPGLRASCRGNSSSRSRFSVRLPDRPRRCCRDEDRRATDRTLCG